MRAGMIVVLLTLKARHPLLTKLAGDFDVFIMTYPCLNGFRYVRNIFCL